MKKYVRAVHPWAWVVMVGILLTAAFTLIEYYGAEKAVDDRMSVAATIFPVHDLVRTIGGERVNVSLLLPEGEGPEALPNLYRGVDLSDMRAIFAIGLGYDTTGMPAEHSGKVMTLDGGIDLLLEQGSTGSPYYWLSPKHAQQMARTITDQLTELDPGSAEYYAGNLEQVLQQLEALDLQIRKLFSELPRRQMIVYGYDWGYFAREYDLDIIDFEPVGQISDSRVEEMRKLAFDRGLVAIFTDIRISSEPFLPAMAQQYLSLFHLDIYGGVEERMSYIATMAYNARSIYEGLTGAP